jgi:hypothetical protein
VRYYSITLKNAKTGRVYVPPGFGNTLGGASYASQVNGVNLPAAWNVEMDLFVNNAGTPVGNGSVTIWGVSLQEIWQAQDLNNYNIEIYGGMAKGLPLATAQAQYAGLLVKGQVLPAFGNWIDVDQTLNLTIVPGFSNGGAPLFGSNTQPVNLSSVWKKGTSAVPWINSLFQTALPGLTPKVTISPNLTAPQDLAFTYGTLDGFATALNAASKNIVSTTGYSGVQIAPDWTTNTINVYDNTQMPSSPTKQLDFADLIGQPTWLGPIVNFKTPMRSDFKIGTLVKMPQQLANLGVVGNTQAALTYRNRSAFSGMYQVNQVRHVGNFREPSGDAWVTSINATPFPLTGT